MIVVQVQAMCESEWRALHLVEQVAIDGTVPIPNALARMHNIRVTKVP